MKRETGFSLLELLVATAILVIVVAVTLGALSDAIHANEGVTLLADMMENLRAGMNYMVRDLIQAGEGIPIGGITIPNNSAGGVCDNTAAPINRPSPPALAYTFSQCYTALPAIAPGPALVPTTVPPAGAGQVLVRASDMISVLYADNTVQWHNFPPINNPNNPTCGGTISGAGESVTFDGKAGCTPLPVGNVAVQPGDLMMFTNAAGNILQTVTGVNGQTLRFAAGDAFNLNGRNDPQGTIQFIQQPVNSNNYPPTSAIRVWLITYYIDNVADPLRPRLMRQVNFRQAQPVGEVMEDLQVSYDIVDAAATAPPMNAKAPVPPDTPTQIRKANLYLSARSDAPYSQSKMYFRNNLVTQVSFRSLAFVSRYQ
jgi:prepilin-type N-terminal cleavage/methylation domain-containing protein